MILSGLSTPAEAVASITRRRLMPTDLGSAQLQQLVATTRSQSLYSAHTLLSDLLAGYKTRIGIILNPRTAARPDRVTESNPTGATTEGLNFAQARVQTQQLLDELGYEPDPEKRGTIQDLSSDARVNLVLQTNVQMVQGEAWWLQGQNAPVLDQWPAQELFRAEGRAKQRDWLERFRRAGEQSGDPIGTGWTVTSDGRLIAIKNHKIWFLLGSPDLFPDGLGQPWPPFAFNSGMDVRDVDRDETEQLGLIDPGDQVQPMTLDQAIAQMPAKEAA
jgi:hypothetical protein